jgi:dihydroorotate dehydrogenase (NAD+) catalytic subunit
VNILGNTIQEYVRLSKELDAAGVDAIELNVSCPNVKKGGIIFGTDKRALSKLVSKVKQSAGKSLLITKLSPNVSDITEFAVAAEESGSDALSLINTLRGMAIDIETRRPKLANITGGLSGPAIKPVALRMVWEASQSVRIPVIGIGGIINAQDAIEFMLAGATAIQVGTGNFINPMATIEIIHGIRSYSEGKNIDNIRDIIGSIHGTAGHNNINH